MENGTLNLMAVGDVLIDRPDPSNVFSKAKNLLQKSDILFGNCEGAYTVKTERAPNARLPIVSDPKNSVPLKDIGFDVMSIANNHIVDGGHQGLLDTVDILHKHGILTTGAGANLEEAYKPVILMKKSMKIGFLSYSSVFPYGYEARRSVPGLAPLRAYNLYFPMDPNGWDPGLQPQIVTTLDDDDLTQVQNHIQQLREQVDIVVVSMHWGDYTRPIVLTDHERQTARLLIDAGADIILGHHHHFLRGIEYYDGKPIFYGLGHFVFDLPNINQRLARESEIREDSDLPFIKEHFGEYGMWPREDYPLLPFHPDARMTMVAIFQFKDKKLNKAGVIPCMIRKSSQPEPLDSKSKEGKQVLDYLKKCCDSENLNVTFEQTTENEDGVTWVHDNL